MAWFRHSAWILAMFLAVGLQAQAQTPSTSGKLEGRVYKGEEPVPAAVVIIAETRASTLTEEDGRFAFDDVPPGRYTVIFTLGSNSKTVPGVGVSAGSTTQLPVEVDWELGIVAKVTVTAAAEAAKTVDSPAAVTSVPEEEIRQVASTGQVPKALEFTPGAEVTQSGLFDFNFNTRGFNSSLNRRVSTYIDGRDVGVVLLGAQEWSAISGALDDVASLEFIRGPSAALYGANASSGVINIVTKAPRENLGSFVRVSGGELDTTAIDFRHSDKLAENWFAKFTGGIKASGDFTVSRNPDVDPTPEYSEYCDLIGETDCLPAEKTLFRSQDNDIVFGSVRVDRYLPNSLLTFEAGYSDVKGPVFQTGIGRIQTLSSERPFFRVAWADPTWNLQGFWSGRKGDQANLTQDLRVNFELITDTERYGVEGQGKWFFFDEKVRWVLGGAHTEERVDTTNPATGRQTVVNEAITADRQAVFTQLDWQATDRFKFVVAGRVDANTLHQTRFSPKAAVVYKLDDTNSIRLTYNEAFQVANYSEFFLNTRISAFPIGGFVSQICSSPALPQPVDCGIDDQFIDIVAVGNDDLALEKTQAWEIGYSGVVARRFFFSLDYYRADNQDFITDLIPQVGLIPGTLEGCVDSAGNPESDPFACPVNPDFLPWVGPDEAETTILVPGTDLTVAQALRNAVDNSVGGSTLGFRLGQNLDGSTAVIARTYTNVGEVETQGVDFGVQFFVSEKWKLQASYSWFDFEVTDFGFGDIDPQFFDEDETRDEIAQILLPNTPEHKASMALNYRGDRWNGSLGGRWVDDFRWSAGVCQGPVESYTTVDAAANYRFNDIISAGVNVTNAFDQQQNQTFCGDVLRRRALANVTFRF